MANTGVFAVELVKRDALTIILSHLFKKSPKPLIENFNRLRIRPKRGTSGHELAGVDGQMDVGQILLFCDSVDADQVVAELTNVRGRDAGVEPKRFEIHPGKEGFHNSNIG